MPSISDSAVRRYLPRGQGVAGEQSADPPRGGPVGLPDSLLRYVIAASLVHQLPLIALTVSVALLEVVPLELQRRIINDLVKQRPFAAILTLCAIYAGAVLVQGSTKLALNIYRGWIGERSARDLRRHVCAVTAAAGAPAATAAEANGTSVAMIVAEVDPIGGFIGSSLSEPLLQAGILASVIAYLVHLDRWMGAAALVLFLPQLVFVPLMQHAINRRIGARVWLLRQIGAGVIGPRSGAAANSARIERVFRFNMRVYQIKFTMNFLMNLCSHAQIIAALLLGGWWVLQNQLEIGGVVAFISGLGRLNDPWGDLVNYFREISATRVKYRLLTDGLAGLTAPGAPTGAG